MRLQPLGRLPATKRLNLIIGLPLRNREALTNLLATALRSRQSPIPSLPHSRAVRATIWADGTDYQSVIAFAKANGFTVTGTHPNRTLVDINGSVADIERAFHVTMRTYQHPDRSPDIFRARRGPFG